MSCFYLNFLTQQIIPFLGLSLGWVEDLNSYNLLIKKEFYFYWFELIGF